MKGVPLVGCRVALLPARTPDEHAQQGRSPQQIEAPMKLRRDAQTSETQALGRLAQDVALPRSRRSVVARRRPRRRPTRERFRLVVDRVSFFFSVLSNCRAPSALNTPRARRDSSRLFADPRSSVATRRSRPSGAVRASLPAESSRGTLAGFRRGGLHRLALEVVETGSEKRLRAPRRRLLPRGSGAWLSRERDF